MLLAPVALTSGTVSLALLVTCALSYQQEKYLVQSLNLIKVILTHNAGDALNPQDFD